MWTRAEIMARLGRFDNLEYINYAIIENELRDKIREKLFGSSNLVILGEKWNMLKDKKNGKSKKT